MVTKPASPWYYAGTTGGIVNTTAVALVAAVANQRNFLSGLQYFNTAAVASEIVILDGVTIIWRGNVPVSMTVPVAMQFDPPLQSSTNAALNVQLLTTATATRVSAQGMTDP